MKWIKWIENCNYMLNAFFDVFYMDQHSAWKIEMEIGLVFEFALRINFFSADSNHWNLWRFFENIEFSIEMIVNGSASNFNRNGTWSNVKIIKTQWCVCPFWIDLNNFEYNFYCRYKIQPAKKDPENGIVEFNPFLERKNQHPTS